jgi:hypothetical protein
MNRDNNHRTSVGEENQFDGYEPSPWPQRGRLVFGPWCLLGVWPVIFGVVEKVEEQKQEGQ